MGRRLAEWLRKKRVEARNKNIERLMSSMVEVGIWSRDISLPEAERRIYGNNLAFPEQEAAE